MTEQRLPASADLDALSIDQALRLINDQDATVAATVRGALDAINRLVAATVTALRDGGRLIYIGAGTSGRLGVLDASECPPTFHSDPDQVVGLIAGGDCALRRSSEGMEDDPQGARAELERLNVAMHDVVVGIAAGGTTPYVRGAVTMAKARGAVTALICCTQVNEELASQVDHLILVPVGPEVVTGSTRMKAGTATKMVLNMITTVAMVQLGKTWGNLMVALHASNAKLRDRAARILMRQTVLSRDDAMRLLDLAGGSVKLALVMALKNLDAPAAARLLDRHGGRLRPVLGPPR